MPTVYLSPSTQEYNEYYDKSGSEEYYMNLIADAMVPLLEQRGITVNRNSPNMTASQSAAQSASGENGLHLAIHSNAAGVGNAGNVRGVDVDHYAPSREGKRAAEIIARDMRNIYPDPALVRVLGNTAFVELLRTKAPAVLIEVGYHDNPADAEWIKSNIDAIAGELTDAVAEFLGAGDAVPPSGYAEQATVDTAGSRLNLRNAPSFDGEIIGKLPDGATVGVIKREGAWTYVEYYGKKGYVYSQYLSLD